MDPAMNFHLAAKNLRLENNRYLRASVSIHGAWIESMIDLDLYIGNLNGVLAWGGSNFSQEGTNIKLGKDPGNGWCPLVFATLPDSRGVAKSSGLYLGRCIGIENHGLSCDISKAHLTQPVENRQRGVNFFVLPPRGYR